jgi:GNAT superfamily N-acetyltransferase
MPAVISQERPDSTDGRSIIDELTAEIEPLYPPEYRHGYTVQRMVDENVAFFLIRDGDDCMGCGGIQLVGGEYAEIKRMYVRPAYRGLGLAKMMLEHLAEYARARGVLMLRLETGIYQPAAIDLYERFGFREIPPFGAYHPSPLNRFYEKRLKT